jgi:hypothetical protein
MKAKLSVTLITLVLFVFPLFLTAGNDAQATVAARASALRARLPLSFEPAVTPENYLARAAGYTVSVTPRETSIIVPGTAGTGHIMRVVLENSNEGATLEPLDPLPGVTNYYLGSDAKQWRLGVLNYARLRTKGAYPGVDLLYYGDQQRLEFDFVVAPGASTKTISLALSGADALSTNAAGDLVASVQGHEIRFARPVAYQRIAGVVKPVAADYVLAGGGKVQLRVGAYDSRSELIIDPVVTYATYFGGLEGDFINGMAVDSAGAAYITGETCSPTLGGVTAAPSGACDAFVTKINPSGTATDYTTVIGGTADPSPTSTISHGIALDGNGNAYIVGETNSTTLAATAKVLREGASGTVTSAYFGGDKDAFIAIVEPTHGSLVRLAYLGGSGTDIGYGITVDNATPPNVIAVGETCIDTKNALTQPPDFPAYNGFERKVEYCVAFVTKLDNNLDLYVQNPLTASYADPPPAPSGTVTYYFSEYFGGQPIVPTGSWQPDHRYLYGDIISTEYVSTDGTVGYNAQKCIQAGTSSGLAAEPYPWPDQTNATTTDNTVIWEDMGPPQALIYASTTANAVAVDPLNDIFAVGGTDSAFIGSAGGAADGYSYWQGAGAWILKVHSTGEWVYSTHLTTTATDAANAVAVDTGGDAYIVGTSTGGIFTASDGNSFQSTNGGGTDAFLVRLASTGTSIVYSGYLGGSGDDQGLAVAVDINQAVYIAGSTKSTNFPVVDPLINPLSTPPNTPMNGLVGSQDAFVAKVASDGSALAFSTYLGGSNADYGTAIAVHQNSTSGANDIYVAGDTTSSDFPAYPVSAPAALQTTCGDTGGACNNGDGFVALIPGTSVPSVSLSPTTLAFGPVTLNTTSVSQTVTFANSGATAITITNITITPGNFVAQYTCGYTLSPGKSCTITVTFTPTATGDCSGTLTITDNSGTSPHTVALSGSGTALGTGGGTAGSGSSTGSGSTATPDFALAASNGATTLTASPGNTASLGLNLTPSDGFNQTVNLTCTVPSPATCALNPTSILVSGTSAATSTVTVTLPSASGSSSTNTPKGASLHRRGPWNALLPFSVFGFALIGGRRRSWLPLLLLALCFALMLAGCGGGSAGSSASTPTLAPGNYNLTVTATYTGAASPHVLTVTLQVTQ